MLAEDFIAAKKASWERLSALLDHSRLGGLAGLSAEELAELGRLYRSATSDLAVARRDFADHRVVDFLNGLVARGHGAVYQNPAARRRDIAVFFSTTFPRTFRATWPYTFAAFLMFLLPALAGFWAAYRDPAAGAALLPGIEERIQDIRDKHEWWKDLNDGNAAGASLIMTNNIQVTILAFAGGTLMGVFTLYLLAQNGLMLGVLAGAAQALGFAGNLWGFVAGHGTLELSAIFIAGGAGMQLGWSLLRPGLLTRRAALVLASRRAALLLLGCVPILVLAGTIEGFLSPSDQPLALKLAVSLLSGVLLYGYLLLAGRERRPPRYG
ncbi:MAG TPA: stage II sporulation protein M [Kouleothrix sp.]|uniref:stage II sporulation protein M n=1 Tax=Kouleothrix sp. TaxID=2779161 RepID=UPI002B9AF117|nr:stage II sporulation protein M [Kouleothrix sp.]